MVLPVPLERPLLPRPPFNAAIPAKELTLRPAVAPANVCRAPREAMGLTELLLLELGEDPELVSTLRGLLDVVRALVPLGVL